MAETMRTPTVTGSDAPSARGEPGGLDRRPMNGTEGLIGQDGRPAGSLRTAADEHLGWRLVRPCYVPGLDGEGARRAGGRWNSPGRPAVYTASYLSLAVLECFLDLPKPQRVPDRLPEMRALCVAVAADLMEEVPEDLDPNDLQAARAFGDRWLDEGRSLALRVPSAVIPCERNLILNPHHPAMADLQVVAEQSFRFDPRLVDPGADNGG